MELDYHEMDLQLASANDQIKELTERCDRKRRILTAIQAMALRQREDGELWHQPGTAFGLRMQQALREIHHLILDDKE
jgi:hypothetical protein